MILGKAIRPAAHNRCLSEEAFRVACWKRTQRRCICWKKKLLARSKNLLAAARFACRRQNLCAGGRFLPPGAKLLCFPKKAYALSSKILPPWKQELASASKRSSAVRFRKVGPPEAKVWRDACGTLVGEASRCSKNLVLAVVFTGVANALH